MAVSKVILNGTTLMDVTQDTVAANKLLSGETAHKNDGTAVTGDIATKTSSDLTVSGATVTAPAGHYASAASKSVASGTAGTPTATKSAVSNHAISVTPSVTNTTGYISGGTKTGTAVTVTAAELVSGSETKTANGTYDVTNIAELVVNVSGGGGLEYETGTFSPDSLTGEYQITFSKTHTTAPFFYMILDTTGTYLSESNRNHSLIYANFGQFFGEAIDVDDAGKFNYGNQISRYRVTNATSMGGSSGTISTSYTDPTDTGTGDSRYWATETGIKAYTGSTLRYWSPNRTYSWVAVWAPGT